MRKLERYRRNGRRASTIPSGKCGSVSASCPSLRLCAFTAFLANTSIGFAGLTVRPPSRYDCQLLRRVSYACGTRRSVRGAGDALPPPKRGAARSAVRVRYPGMRSTLESSAQVCLYRYGSQSRFVLRRTGRDVIWVGKTRPWRDSRLSGHSSLWANRGCRLLPVRATRCWLCRAW